MKYSAMLVLGTCFGLAFLGRIAVLAETIAEEGKRVDAAPTHASAAASSSCLTASFAEEIQARIATLNDREHALAEKEAEFVAYSAQIEKRLGELKTANTELQSRIDELDARQSKDIEKLASIYNSIKPRSAGEILLEMDPGFAAGLLSHMDDQQAAAILASMDPQKAYAVSLRLATRTQE